MAHYLPEIMIGISQGHVIRPKSKHHRNFLCLSTTCLTVYTLHGLKSLSMYLSGSQPLHPRAFPSNDSKRIPHSIVVNAEAGTFV